MFILATTEVAKIPATILSRCMRFDFKLIPQADLEERLRYVLDSIGKTYEKEAISAIARAGAGSVRDMLSIADTCVSYSSGTLTYADVTSVLGSADFAGVAAFCAATLAGDAGKAFERAESFLAAGKGVGTLVKDVMNFLNSCTVAKTCRDGKNILSLPDEAYALVEKIARETDGHRLLRATEIFAEVEQNLKYTASPRIVFETAVLKASMPQTDCDVQALFARVAELERRMESGDFKQGEISENAGGRVEMKVEKQSEAVETTATETDVPPELDVPPDEAVTGGNAYFDAEFAPKPVVKKQETPAKALKPAVSGDAKTTFGAFLRALRKTGKNGVLFTICMDLDSAYEGDVFVLSTQSDTIYRSLKKPEHDALIQGAFEAIGLGVGAFDVRLQGKPSDDFNQKIEEIKGTFQGVKVEIK